MSTKYVSKYQCDKQFHLALQSHSRSRHVQQPHSLPLCPKWNSSWISIIGKTCIFGWNSWQNATESNELIIIFKKERRRLETLCLWHLFTLHIRTLLNVFTETFFLGVQVAKVLTTLYTRCEVTCQHVTWMFPGTKSVFGGTKCNLKDWCMQAASAAFLSLLGRLKSFFIAGNKPQQCSSLQMQWRVTKRKFGVLINVHKWGWKFEIISQICHSNCCISPHLQNTVQEANRLEAARKSYIYAFLSLLLWQWIKIAATNNSSGWYLWYILMEPRLLSCFSQFLRLFLLERTQISLVAYEPHIELSQPRYTWLQLEEDM